VDPEDQADQEAPEDQRRIIQLEHQADQKDLAVLEDPEDQEDQADQAAQVVSEKSFANANYLQKSPATRACRQVNCLQVFLADQAVRAALVDQAAQV
jgi:hypothetical protein